MTTQVAPATSLLRRGHALPTLARAEAGRILRHPVYLLLLAYFLLIGGVETAQLGPPPRAAVAETLTYLGLMFVGPATFFAANLVASSARRARAESQLDAAPTGAQARTLATCLGLLGPTAVAIVLVVALWVVEHAGTDLPRAQGPAELAAIPLCTLGGGLAGVAAARWLPWPGAPMLVIFVLIAWVVLSITNRGDLWWTWTAPWSLSPSFHDSAALRGGSQLWHAVYLACLCLLAGTAALLRFRPHRRALFALGAVLMVSALVASWAQLP